MTYPRTTGYGTWCNHGDRSNNTVEATIADAINGGDPAWRHYMEITGALTRIASAYRAAINAKLEPSGIALTGNDFLGPADPSDERLEDERSLYDLINEIDLGEIIEKYDIDNHMIDPRILSYDVMSLFEITWPRDRCCDSSGCEHEVPDYEPEKLQLWCKRCNLRTQTGPLVSIDGDETTNPLPLLLVMIELHLTVTHSDTLKD